MVWLSISWHATQFELITISEKRQPFMLFITCFFFVHHHLSNFHYNTLFLALKDHTCIDIFVGYICGAQFIRLLVLYSLFLSCCIVFFAIHWQYWSQRLFSHFTLQARPFFCSPAYLSHESSLFSNYAINILPKWDF